MRVHWAVEHLGQMRNRIRQNPKIILPIAVILLLLAWGVSALWQALVVKTSSVFSGTIEVTEIHVGTELGGRVEAVNVREGELVKANQFLIEINRLNGGMERIRAPIEGTVLERLVEPGEVAAPGSVVMAIGNLDLLTLTVFVPEDRYGQIFLGQDCQVMVDSYPNQVFHGKVSHIADQAEFTPRNVQTTEGRKNTVFAIRLELDPSGGKLKPGMPADVHFK